MGVWFLAAAAAGGARPDVLPRYHEALERRGLVAPLKIEWVQKGAEVGEEGLRGRVGHVDAVGAWEGEDVAGEGGGEGGSCDILPLLYLYQQTNSTDFL